MMSKKIVLAVFITIASTMFVGCQNSEETKNEPVAQCTNVNPVNGNCEDKK